MIRNGRDVTHAHAASFHGVKYQQRLCHCDQSRGGDEHGVDCIDGNGKSKKCHCLVLSSAARCGDESLSHTIVAIIRRTRSFLLRSSDSPRCSHRPRLATPPLPFATRDRGTPLSPLPGGRGHGDTPRKFCALNSHTILRPRVWFFYPVKQPYPCPPRARRV